MRSSTAGHWATVWREACLHRGWLARLLWPVSRGYAVLARWHRQRYLDQPQRIERVNVPVVVVGNLIVGGAGKTPTTLALIRHLQSHGWHPGIVSRGYGRDGDDVLVLPDEPDPARHGDEPSLLKLATGVPVCVGSRRAQAARQLLQERPEVDVVVCDDGLQHFALGRDLAVAVFDDRGVGNGWLLPAGLLREPWPPARPDALSPHLVLRVMPRLVPALPALPVPAPLPLFEARRQLATHVRWADGTTSDLASLRGQQLNALAGIARPESFFAMLHATGLSPGMRIPLPDHADARTCMDRLNGLQGTLICTEKDAVKLFPLWQGHQLPGLRVGCVPLELEIDPAFFQAVDQFLLEKKRPARLSSPHGHQTA
ncbi:MAG: tetraacyldisaccharide 4'-kinase [Gammaproteobacteria bacterium]